MSRDLCACNVQIRRPLAASQNCSRPPVPRYHQAVGGKCCVGEEPRAPLVDLTELARRSIPQPGRAIAARSEDLMSCHPAPRNHPADVTLKRGDDSIVLEVQQQRRC